MSPYDKSCLQHRLAGEDKLIPCAEASLPLYTNMQLLPDLPPFSKVLRNAYSDQVKN